jgi:hypothetical protein
MLSARALEGFEPKLQSQVDPGLCASLGEARSAQGRRAMKAAAASLVAAGEAGPRARRARGDAAGFLDHSAIPGPAMEFFFATVRQPGSRRKWPEGAWVRAYCRATGVRYTRLLADALCKYKCVLLNGYSAHFGPGLAFFASTVQDPRSLRQWPAGCRGWVRAGRPGCDAAGTLVGAARVGPGANDWTCGMGALLCMRLKHACAAVADAAVFALRLFNSTQHNSTQHGWAT